MNLMSRHGFENGFPENFTQKMRMEKNELTDTIHYIIERKQQRLCCSHMLQSML